MMCMVHEVVPLSLHPTLPQPSRTIVCMYVTLLLLHTEPTSLAWQQRRNGCTMIALLGSCVV